MSLPLCACVTNMEALFHEAIEFSVKKLGMKDLKKEQYDALRAICVEKKDVLAVLPTGFGKSLIYQVLPTMFDYMRNGCEPVDAKQNSIVIIVSPLNALMRNQMQKLERVLNVCVLQSVDESEEKASVMKDFKEFSLVFGHPEVFVDNKNVAKLLKSKDVQRRVKAIVVDEAHLVLEWYLYTNF